MENNIIISRLSALRGKMSRLGIDCFLIPTADPHSSEYVAEHFQTRRFFSGFTGSSGTLAVGREKAGLWTDGRYFIQAEKELRGTGVDLYREGEEGVPTVPAWISRQLEDGGALGFDGRCVSVRTFRALRKVLSGRRIRFVTEYDPADGIWTDRPPRPANPVFVLEEKYAGESAAAKLGRVREAMRAEGAGIYVESKLDNLMWLLNLRGRDIACTPVALGFGVFTMERAVLFLQESACTDAVRAYAGGIGLELRPYDSVYSFLEDPSLYRASSGAASGEKEKVLRVLFQPGSLNCRLLAAIQRGQDRARSARLDEPELSQGAHTAHDSGRGTESEGPSGGAHKSAEKRSPCFAVEKRSPVEDFKAVKNAVELRNIRDCYREDSAAVCRFLYWLHCHVREGTIGSLTELDAAERMDALRAGIDDFVELSFGTISAYGANAAMMHYAAKPGDCARLRPEGMLLVDCGGQYLRGTTDVTRTMALGPVTQQMRRHYTLTAVGNLQLMDAVFLYGCTGRNVDILARQPLWNTFVDYKCGTGHGIGYLLSVHEGPQNIRWRFVGGLEEAVLEPGMIVSDEPGVYIEGEYGIRIETILEVVEAAKNGDGRFLRFSPLTLVPFDPALIDPQYLTPQTREALNRYHARVCAEISPLLLPAERDWLRAQTEPV
ncbi:MAG: aminopeptidase P family protein [Eubacteriales bacterium]|nr:aminopeptidase P family protein [Eubacteriales bacterium]